VRASGHRGPLIALHEERQLLADVDALVNNLDSVRSAVRGLVDAAPAVAGEWQTHLRALLRRPDLWAGRLDRLVIVELLHLIGTTADCPQASLF
jgi:hypothetical protein